MPRLGCIQARTTFSLTMRTLTLGLTCGGLLLASSSAAAQTSSGRQPPIVVSRASDAFLMKLSVNPLADGNIGLILASISAGGCRFGEAFEAPIQLDATGFQLKRVARVRHELLASGQCVEALVMAYTPEAYSELLDATSVVLHLPGGPLPLPAAAIEAMALHRPSSTPAPGAGSLRSAIVRLNEMLRNGQAADAVSAAESLVPYVSRRPPAEGIQFFATLGMARRKVNNLDGAALCYEIALHIADASGDTSLNSAIVADNLSIVRRLQGRWEDAEAASDRALATLSRARDGEAQLAYGVALNNRALLLDEQGLADDAVEYSDRAVAILRDALKDEPETLASFLQDNESFKRRAQRQ